MVNIKRIFKFLSLVDFITQNYYYDYYYKFFYIYRNFIESNNWHAKINENYWCKIPLQ